MPAVGALDLPALTRMSLPGCKLVASIACPAHSPSFDKAHVPPLLIAGSPLSHPCRATCCGIMPAQSHIWVKCECGTFLGICSRPKTFGRCCEARFFVVRRDSRKIRPDAFQRDLQYVAYHQHIEHPTQLRVTSAGHSYTDAHEQRNPGQQAAAKQG